MRKLLYIRNSAKMAYFIPKRNASGLQKTVERGGLRLQAADFRVPNLGKLIATKNTKSPGQPAAPESCEGGWEK
jgi:hypothetical protein